MAHTPGPWKVSGRVDADHLPVLASNGTFVAWADCPEKCINRSNAADDANLIAAAPALAEALRNAVALWGYQSTDAPQLTWLKQANAALNGIKP